MIVLTSFTNYTKDQIFPFVSSLDSTNFNGRKIIIYYNPDIKIIEFLREYGWEVYTYPKPKLYINVQRRADFIELIEKLELHDETICCTDIRDVLFAKDPSEIPSNFFLGFDDNVTIEHSTWNSNSIKLRHPQYYDELKNFIPLNAGVMITEGSIMKDFFTDYCKIITDRNYSDTTIPCSGVDQSTFNLLAYTKYKTLLSNISNQFVLHMANMDIEENSDIKGYHIYHQYERNKKHFDYVVNLNKKSYI